ncbi:MAG: zinc-binding alcohol dehydrogenase, partial [Chloroflexota bacterium]
THNNPTVIFTEPQVAILENRPVPNPASGQLLIKSQSTLISTGTELTIFSGDFPKESIWARLAQFPCPSGYSSVGEVIDVGPDLSQDWLGKRVTSKGNHAGYVTVEAQTVVPIPDGVPTAQATFSTLAGTVMNAVRRAGVGWGDVVVIYGAGILGQLAARFCRLAGAHRVVSIDLVDSRLARLPDDRAFIPVNPTQTDVTTTVDAVTKGRLADIVFEGTGNPKLIPDELKVLRRHGRFILMSSPRGKTEFDFHDLCNSPSFTIIGTHGSSNPPYETPDTPWTRSRNNEFFFDLILDGALDLAPMISHKEPYTEAPRLFDMLLKDRSQAMGVVLEWSHVEA